MVKFILGLVEVLHVHRSSSTLIPLMKASKNTTILKASSVYAKAIRSQVIKEPDFARHHNANTLLKKQDKKAALDTSLTTSTFTSA